MRERIIQLSFTLPSVDFPHLLRHRQCIIVPFLTMQKILIGMSKSLSLDRCTMAIDGMEYEFMVSSLFLLF